MKIAMQNAEVLSSSPKSPTNHHIKVPASVKVAAVRGVARHIRRSHSGKGQFSFLAPTHSPMEVATMSAIASTQDRVYFNCVPLPNFSLIKRKKLRRLLQCLPHLDVKIKWPNDIYLNGLKVGGISCNSTYKSGKFNVSAGVGLNLDNEKPTTCLNTIIQALPFTLHNLKREEILAAFFNKFEVLFETFVKQVDKKLP